MKTRLEYFCGSAFLLAIACGSSSGPDGAGSGGENQGGEIGDGDGDTASGGGTSGDGDISSGGGTPGDGDGDGDSLVLLPPSQAPQISYCPFEGSPNLDAFEGRRVIRVCPLGDERMGCHVETLSDAMATAENGDRIEVVGDGADYVACVVVPDTLRDIEIAGVCGRPHLRDTVCQQKGVIVNNSAHLTLTNLEISGAQIAQADGGNAAAIRDQSLGGLNLRYVHFHDNQNGILGGVGMIQIDWSRFESNGSAEDPGYTHNTYFAPEVSEVVIQNSLFLRAGHEGNNMKSRAQKMTFRCSVSASLDGIDSREMDLSQGGELVIENSLIQQGEASVNSGMIGFATESENPELRNAIQSITIVDTDFINDKANGTFLAYNAFDTAVTLTNVRFVGAGTTVNNINGGMETVRSTNVTTAADRAAAGMPGASSDHFKLPKPPGCPDFEYF